MPRFGLAPVLLFGLCAAAFGSTSTTDIETGYVVNKLVTEILTISTGDGAAVHLSEAVSTLIMSSYAVLGTANSALPVSVTVDQHSITAPFKNATFGTTLRSSSPISLPGLTGFTTITKFSSAVVSGLNGTLRATSSDSTLALGSSLSFENTTTLRQTTSFGIASDSAFGSATGPAGFQNITASQSSFLILVNTDTTISQMSASTSADLTKTMAPGVASHTGNLSGT